MSKWLKVQLSGFIMQHSNAQLDHLVICTAHWLNPVFAILVPMGLYVKISLAVRIFFLRWKRFYVEQLTHTYLHSYLISGSPPLLVATWPPNPAPTFTTACQRTSMNFATASGSPMPVPTLWFSFSLSPLECALLTSLTVPLGTQMWGSALDVVSNWSVTGIKIFHSVGAVNAFGTLASVICWLKQYIRGSLFWFWEIDGSVFSIAWWLIVCSFAMLMIVVLL